MLWDEVGGKVVENYLRVERAAVLYSITVPALPVVQTLFSLAIPTRSLAVWREMAEVGTLRAGQPA